MQRRDAKNNMKKYAKKPCNKKYASKKIQKWHKTDIKSSSQLSQGYSMITNHGKVSIVQL